VRALRHPERMPTIGYSFGSSLPFPLLGLGACRCPSIRFLEFASGQTSELFRKEGRFVEGLAVSPGEEWILYSESHRGQSELMLMENFR
jgi:hypothetical protein